MRRSRVYGMEIMTNKNCHNFKTKVQPRFLWTVFICHKFKPEAEAIVVLKLDTFNSDIFWDATFCASPNCFWVDLKRTLSHHDSTEQAWLKRIILDTWWVLSRKLRYNFLSLIFLFADFLTGLHFHNRLGGRRIRSLADFFKLMNVTFPKTRSVFCKVYLQSKSLINMTADPMWRAIFSKPYAAEGLGLVVVLFPVTYAGALRFSQT